MSIAELATLVSVLTVLVSIVGLIFSQFNISRRQSQAMSEELRLMADLVAETRLRQSTTEESKPREADLMMRAASEFSYSTDRFTGVVEAILRRIASPVDEEAIARPQVQHDSSGARLPSTGFDADCAQVIRELAHSLGTPLAQIKAEAVRRGAVSGGHDESSDRITASVDLCNSFLSSFREIARISGHSSILSLASLGDALQTTADMYMSQDEKLVDLVISVPNQIDGYSNTYLLSILAPLIENAIEASPEGELVKISCRPSSDSVTFVITNNFRGESPDSRSFAPGSSTKAGHDGMGLAIVRRLVETQRNGNVNVLTNGNAATFSVSLPKRQG